MRLISMAVDASHRDMIYQGDASRLDYPFHTAYTNKTEEIHPMYGSEMTDLFPAKAGSGDILACSFPSSRKRLRESSFCIPKVPVVHPNQYQFGSLEFLSDDIASQIYQQQLEIDSFVAQHTEKVKTSIREIRRRNTIKLTAAYEEMANYLKTKEEEIAKIAQLNRSLEEKVKSITIENQIWRELAQTNEATANTLRNNLQQLLIEIQLQQGHQNCLESNGNVDAESQSGSNFDEDNEKDARGLGTINNEFQYFNTSGTNNIRWCRICGKEESCVLRAHGSRLLMSEGTRAYLVKKDRGTVSTLNEWLRKLDHFHRGSMWRAFADVEEREMGGDDVEERVAFEIVLRWM
ncbi:hypothetical protein M8C21_005011 [Ambrosia artemisiifolia]|uniref:Uncharacterized protein n=1 Tax=Ambrosia artemisiifolia TaxID=4212 RepID=A0AAD5GXV0_AMBAR|nr:hypothetical protein M8C21_005011 [Ambrosia artemisiifolia]